MRSVICLISLVFLPLFASSSWGMIVTSQRDSYSYNVNPVVENSQNYLYDVATNLVGGGVRQSVELSEKTVGGHFLAFIDGFFVTKGTGKSVKEGIYEFTDTAGKNIAVSPAIFLIPSSSMLEGIRKVCSLRFAIGDPENDVFIPLRAIDSETDHYPLGEMRAKCADDYLRRMDTEMENYLEEAWHDILDVCRYIIRIYGC